MRLVFVPNERNPYGNFEKYDALIWADDYYRQKYGAAAVKLRGYWKPSTNAIYWGVNQGRITVWVKTGRGTRSEPFRHSEWLVEGPARMGELSEKETARALADMCVLRYNLKGESE